MATLTYKLKTIDFLGRKVPVVLQNENGPCPLLAIANVLLLRNQIELPVNCPEVSQERLISLVAGFLLDSNSEQRLGKQASEEYKANLRQHIADAIARLPKLTTGVDVNVQFHDIRGFEFTDEVAIFDLMDINLVHGWLADPQDTVVAEAIGRSSYNDLVSRLVASLGSNTPKRLLSARSFSSQRSTSFGTPKAQRSSGSGTAPAAQEAPTYPSVLSESTVATSSTDGAAALPGSSLPTSGNPPARQPQETQPELHASSAPTPMPSLHLPTPAPDAAPDNLLSRAAAVVALQHAQHGSAASMQGASSSQSSQFPSGLASPSATSPVQSAGPFAELADLGPDGLATADGSASPAVHMLTGAMSPAMTAHSAEVPATPPPSLAGAASVHSMSSLGQPPLTPAPTLAAGELPEQQASIAEMLSSACTALQQQPGPHVSLPSAADIGLPTPGSRSPVPAGLGTSLQAPIVQILPPTPQTSLASMHHPLPSGDLAAALGTSPRQTKPMHMSPLSSVPMTGTSPSPGGSVGPSRTASSSLDVQQASIRGFSPSTSPGQGPSLGPAGGFHDGAGANGHASAPLVILGAGSSPSTPLASLPYAARTPTAAAAVPFPGELDASGMGMGSALSLASGSQQQALEEEDSQALQEALALSLQLSAQGGDAGITSAHELASADASTVRPAESAAPPHAPDQQADAPQLPLEAQVHSVVGQPVAGDAEADGRGAMDIAMGPSSAQPAPASSNHQHGPAAEAGPGRSELGAASLPAAPIDQQHQQQQAQQASGPDCEAMMAGQRALTSEAVAAALHAAPQGHPHPSLATVSSMLTQQGSAVAAHLTSQASADPPTVAGTSHVAPGSGGVPEASALPSSRAPTAQDQDRGGPAGAQLEAPLGTQQPSTGPASDPDRMRSPEPSTGSAAESDRGARKQEALLIQHFLESTSSQLTHYGLVRLHEGLKPRELAVFFRNNHFNTIFFHNDHIHILVTDQGYMFEKDVVWERLTAVNGDTEFVSSSFAPFASHASELQDQAATAAQLAQAAFAQVVPPRQPLGTAAGGSAAVDSDADFALALQLQQEEERREEDRRAAAQQAQRAEQQGQQAQQQGKAQPRGSNSTATRGQAGRGASQRPQRGPSGRQPSRTSSSAGASSSSGKIVDKMADKCTLM